MEIPDQAGNDSVNVTLEPQGDRVYNFSMDGAKFPRLHYRDARLLRSSIFQ